MVDYGRYSSALRNYTVAQSETIGNRLARLVRFDDTPSGQFRFPHFRAVYFSSTAEPSMRFTMYVSCRDDHACEDAEAMFRTLRFR